MLISGDARQIPLKAQSVQCVVTSPPYWKLRDYGTAGQIGLEPTPEKYVDAVVDVFREVWRVLKSDGMVWLNLGDSYAKTVFLNDGLKPKDLIGIPWRVALALQADGWYLRSDIIWHKPNPMPESVIDRPTKSHEYLFLFTKKMRYYYDADAVREPNAINPNWNYGSERYRRIITQDVYGTDGDNKRRKAGPKGWSGLAPSGPHGSGRNRRTVWTVPTQPTKGAHFATFPEKLIEPCILAGSKEGDIVFDPFVGSGTTIQVAKRHNRKGVGLDLAYQDIAKIRINNIKKEK